MESGEVGAKGKKEQTQASHMKLGGEHDSFASHAHDEAPTPHMTTPPTTHVTDDAHEFTGAGFVACERELRAERAELRLRRMLEVMRERRNTRTLLSIGGGSGIRNPQLWDHRHQNPDRRQLQ